MNKEIKANFKQATVKGGAAELKFEILTSAAGAFDIIKHSGEVVMLGIDPVQEEIDFAEYEAEAVPEEIPFEKPANVDYETGEVYDEITDEARMLEGGEEQ